MNIYHVTYYYLATGMKGKEDTKDYGNIEAPTAYEAKLKVAYAEYPIQIEYITGIDSSHVLTDINREYREWLISCLTATPVYEKKKRCINQSPNQILARKRNQFKSTLLLLQSALSNLDPKIISKDDESYLISISLLTRRILKRWDPHYIKKTFPSTAVKTNKNGKENQNV